MYSYLHIHSLSPVATFNKCGSAISRNNRKSVFHTFQAAGRKHGKSGENNEMSEGGKFKDEDEDEGGTTR